MSKRSKDLKKSEEPTEKPKTNARREFLSKTGLTAGGVLMTTLAAGSVSKAQQITATATTTDKLLTPDVFKTLFDQAVTDTRFQDDILVNGFKAVEARGYTLQIPFEERAALENFLFVAAPAKPKCGVCGVCGLCGLCGEVNLGSASAALWALFALKS